MTESSLKRKIVNNPLKDWLFIEQPSQICLQWKGVNCSISLGQCAPLLGLCGGLDGTLERDFPGSNQS